MRAWSVRWIAWVRARPLWVWAAVAVLGAPSLLYFLPLVLVPEAGFDESRLKAANDLRTTFVQAIGGAVLILGTWRTLHINREGQITERFTRAIDQLGQAGGEKLDVRLGGIYALERIARESDSDRGPIIEVLTAFLREHARWNPDNAETPAVTGSDEGRSWNEQRLRLRADFQAVATVLGRNDWSSQQPFDLRDVDLQHADLSNAHLERALFSGAHLEEALLVGAHLEDADFRRAHLGGAKLVEADLEDADFRRAHLERAVLTGAYLKGALLAGARLEGAILYGAHLREAVLVRAHLEQAKLTDANLERARLMLAHLGRADLSRARLEGANLIEADLDGAKLVGAHLEGANLTDANLQGARVTGAHFGGAKLTGARLTGVIGLATSQMEGVIGLSEATGVPPGLLGT